jgi:MoaA/NifB/PqqE/SkfB family radical SAM enzyme
MAENKKPTKLPKELSAKNFCYFPFTQMLLQPTGLVSPCCWKQDLIVGEIEKAGMMDIWNGEKMRTLRREFLEGKPVSCDQQMRHMACHLWSHRLAKIGVELNEVQTEGPRRLDLRLNGRCNLKCVMCEVWKQPNGLYDKSDFWKVAPTEIFPYLVEMDVLGGEPMIQHDTYRLIREVSEVNDRCTWSFVTNGQYRLGSVVLNHLDLIKIRWIQVSIDSLNSETYKAIRPGSGDLSRVLTSLKELLEYRYERLLERRGFDVTVSICIQKRNWAELGEFLDFARDLRVSPIVQFAYIPDSESLLNLTGGDRSQVLDYFESLIDRHSEVLLEPVLGPLRDSFKVSAQPALRSEL